MCNLGVGFNGMVNGEARKTRWLRGLPLYAWAFLKSMVKHFDKPTMTIRFDDREVTTPTLALSVLNGQREGNFPLRPNAWLTDGLLRLHARDAAHRAGTSSATCRRWFAESCRRITSWSRSGARDGSKSSCEAPLCVHADGEFVCVPEDGLPESRWKCCRGD